MESVLIMCGHDNSIMSYCTLNINVNEAQLNRQCNCLCQPRSLITFEKKKTTVIYDMILLMSVNTKVVITVLNCIYLWKCIYLVKWWWIFRCKWCVVALLICVFINPQNTRFWLWGQQNPGQSGRNCVWPPLLWGVVTKTGEEQPYCTLFFFNMIHIMVVFMLFF